jgi:hypothetical protein
MYGTTAGICQLAVNKARAKCATTAASMPFISDSPQGPLASGQA